jgi:RimJ/RimL family protein N-acetyltransferase
MPVVRGTMTTEDGWPLATERLLLSPLRASDAAEMFPVLGDIRLHGFTGGKPAASLVELTARYIRLETGLERPTEVWVNWIVRLKAGAMAIGTVQATIFEEAGRTAEVAWVIGVAWQGRGYATEAADALVAWLRASGVGRIRAHVHPDHVASEAVAVRLGMHAMTVHHGGETVWESTTTNNPT